MNTLKIIETSGITESIPFRIISKLYNLLKDSNTQSDSYNLQGRLESRREYKTHTTFLTSKFNRLYINISDAYYVEFADSNVEKEMLRLFGDDGIGVIVSNVNATYLHSTFHKNTMQNIYGTDDINWQIKSFNELSQFTSIKTLDAECFVYQYALESIDLTNITKLGRSNFLGCSNLKTLGDTSNIVSITGESNFLNCSSLTSFELSPLLTTIKASTFEGCTSLTSIDLSHVTKIEHSAFKNSGLSGELSLPNITEFSANCFNGCTGLTHVDFPEIFYCKQSNKGYEFYNCTSLGNGETLELTLGSNLGSNTFRNTKYNKLILHANSEYQIDGFPGSGQLCSFSYMLNCQLCDLSDTVYTYTPKVGEHGENGVLKTIIYPKTVTRCATNFTDCSFKLENIIFLSEEYITPAIDTYWAYAQLTNKANFHIYVKDELLDQYLADNNWGPTNLSWERSSIFKPWSNIPSDITWYTKEHTSIFES